MRKGTSNKKHSIKWNWSGIILRFFIFKRYFFFIRTINELMKEREKMVKIILKEHRLYCIVNDGNTKDQMIDTARDIYKYYYENQELRNFKSDIVTGYTRGKFSLASDICKNYIHEMALKEYHEYRSNKEWTGRRA